MLQILFFALTMFVRVSGASLTMMRTRSADAFSNDGAGATLQPAAGIDFLDLAAALSTVAYLIVAFRVVRVRATVLRQIEGRCRFGACSSAEAPVLGAAAL